MTQGAQRWSLCAFLWHKMLSVGVSMPFYGTRSPALKSLCLFLWHKVPSIEVSVPFLWHKVPSVEISVSFYGTRMPSFEVSVSFYGTRCPVLKSLCLVYGTWAPSVEVYVSFLWHQVPSVNVFVFFLSNKVPSVEVFVPFCIFMAGGAQRWSLCLFYSITGLSYRTARLHRVTESIPWNRFLGSLKVYQYRLCILETWQHDFSCVWLSV